MAKRGIKNEQVYRGRWKGQTDTHVPNKKTRKNHEEIEWNSPQLCEECFCKPCECKNEELLKVWGPI